MYNASVRILTIEEAKECENILYYNNNDTDFVKKIRRAKANPFVNHKELIYQNNREWLEFRTMDGSDMSYLEDEDKIYINHFSVRPVMPISYIPDEVFKTATYDYRSNYKVIKYGYFPQSISMSSNIEDTFDFIDIRNNRCRVYQKCADKNEKLISVLIDNVPEFFDLEPVEWFVDEELGIVISKKKIMTNIPIELGMLCFEDTTLYKWLNSEFLDILTRYERNYYLESLNPLKLNLDIDVKPFFDVEDNEEVEIVEKVETIENDFDSMVNEATKQMEEILGKSYCKK